MTDPVPSKELVQRIEDCLNRLWIDRAVYEASARGLLREAADALRSAAEPAVPGCIHDSAPTTLCQVCYPSPEPAVNPFDQAKAVFAGKKGDGFLLKMWFDTQEDLDKAFDVVEGPAQPPKALCGCGTFCVLGPTATSNDRQCRRIAEGSAQPPGAGQ